MPDWFRFLARLTLFATAGVYAYANNMPTQYILYVGTYSKGIYGFRYDTADSSLTPLSLVGELASPSWIAADHTHKFLFAVSELDGDNKGAVASFSIDRSTGKLTHINSRSSEGFAPCHLAIDKTGKVLVTANYTSGGIASYKLGADGTIGEVVSVMIATGSGPDKERQTGPHAHETVFSANNHFLYVPDLGLDQVRVYKVDTATATLSAAEPPHVQEAPAMGPRHIAFSPSDKFAYVINELKPAVTVYSHDPKTSRLENIQTISSVPDNQTGIVSPAEILIDKAGKFVYASNRGPGTIAVFSVDHQTGKLTLVQLVETGLTEPRGVDFDPTGHTMFIGDQKADKMETFHVDPATGKLTATGKSYELPSPVSFVFVPAN